MIRIDLGKGSQKQGEKLRRFAAHLKLQQPYDELLQKFDNDVSRMVGFLAALGLAILPTLIVNEYERVVTNRFSRKIAYIDKEIAINQAEIATLTPFKQELESYENQKAQVTKKLGIIRSLLSSRSTPVRALDVISQSLPEGVWLENMGYERTDKTVEKVTLSGSSLTNEDISDYLDRLAQSAHLANVRLKQVEASQANGQDARSFQIELDAVTQPLSETPLRDVGSK